MIEDERCKTDKYFATKRYQLKKKTAYSLVFKLTSQKKRSQKWDFLRFGVTVRKKFESRGNFAINERLFNFKSYFISIIINTQLNKYINKRVK